MVKPITSEMAPPRGRPIADAAFDAAVHEGIEAADAGRLSPFEPVAEWLASWGTEDELPPPE
jgi:predicted transcriptional regulator